MRATGTFEIRSWKETPYDETPGRPRLVRATVVESFAGDIQGEGSVEYLMMYRENGSASFIRLQRVVGRIGDRAGSFVLQGTGDYEGVTARGVWQVVPGSGTEELRGLKGEGAFVAHHGEQPVTWAGRTWQPTPMKTAAVLLEYDFD